MERPDKSKSTSDDEKSCCTWAKIIVSAMIMMVSVIVLWVYAPIDKAIDSLLPNFNNTGGYLGDLGTFGDIPPSPAPPPTLIQKSQFMQCKQDKDCCNGLDTICGLGVDEILYATAHNAMASFEDGFLFGPNHRLGLEKALEAGYRGINLDVCNCDGKLKFCHGYCSLGNRDVVEVFMNINEFLDNNPSEIIMVPLEINNNAGGPINLDFLYMAMAEVPGFLQKMYTHENSAAKWPTLLKAVETNKRIFMFQSNGPDCDSTNSSGVVCPEGIHSYDEYALNTQWEFQKIKEIEDTSVSCRLAPGTSFSFRSSQTFFGVNNFVSPPSQGNSRVLNSMEFAKDRIDACSKQHNRDVNFIYADFWSEGDLPQLVQSHNLDLARKRERRNLRS